MTCILAAAFLVTGLHPAVAQHDLVITNITHPSKMSVCTTGVISVTITNRGSSAASPVSLVVTGAPNQELVGAASAGAATIVTQSITRPIVLFEYGDLSPGESRTASITVHAIAIGLAPMNFLVNPTDGDSNPANNSASRTITHFGAATGTDDVGTRGKGGHPVSTFSGREVLTEPPDLDLGGPLPVFLQRHYDGALFEDGVVQSALGHNWQHNYDIRLTVAGTNATLGFRRGRIIRFAYDGAVWNLSLAGRVDIGFRLVETGGEFLLGDPRSQLMYLFNTNGLLVRIEDGRGNTNFLSYGSNLQSVTDGLGRTLNFAYNANNLLTNVTDGVRSVRYAQTSSNLTSFTDANGRVTTYAYTASTNNPGLMTARTLPEGNTPFTQTYDAQGRVIAQVDAANRTNAFAYLPGANGGLTNVMTDPLGNTFIHVYNEFGELSRITDESGRTIGMSQDAAGRRSTVQDRQGVFTGLTYDADTGLPTRIDHPGISDDFFFYTNRTVNGIVFKDLERHARPDNRTNRFEYDAAGNLIRYFLRDGAVFNYGYNARGQITSATNPVGGVANFTYDATARLASSTDTDVGVTTFAYDALNRLTNITHPNPETIQFNYDLLDRLTSVTDERGHTTAFAYDGNSRLTNVVNALGQSSRFEYDALNRLTRAVDRLGNPARFGYDPRTTPDSLLAVVTNRNGFVTRFHYDERRRLGSVENPAGKFTRFGYDHEDRLTAIPNPLGQSARFGLDAMGYLTSATNALGQRVTFVRDAMKRVTTFTNALGFRTTFGYTPRGQLLTVRLPNGITSSNRYDGLGALTNLVDPNNQNWNFARTPMGRLAALTDPLNRSNTYAYDPRGRLARVTFPDGVTFTNSYDGADNLVRRQYSDGTDLQFAYDPLNRLTNAAGSDPIAFTYDAMDRVINTRQVGLNFGASYDADDRLTSVTYSNGLFTVTYGYDSRDRITSVSDNLTGTTLTFAYDDADRLIGVTRPNGVNTTYTYDAAGRLTRIQEGSIVDLRYTLDAAGQIIESDYVAVPLDPAASVTNENTSFTYDAASQLSTAGHQYDPRGRLTNAPNTAFTWDGASRLIGIDSVSFGYNALDDLVTRAGSGNTNRYFYNYAVGLSPTMAERNDNTGQFTRFYVWSPGGLLLYIINLPGNTVSFPHFDQVGSTLALSGSGGTVTDSYAYDPYGRLLSRTGTNSQPFRFNGALGVRAEGLLHHMRARWYDPGSIRFLSKEPLWPALEMPQRLNVYAFAIQNPLNFADPLGDEFITLTVGGVVVMVAAASAIGASTTYIGTQIAEYRRYARASERESARGRALDQKRERLLENYRRSEQFNRRLQELRDREASEPPTAASSQPQPPGAPAAVPQGRPGRGGGVSQPGATPTVPFAPAGSPRPTEGGSPKLQGGAFGSSGSTTIFGGQYGAVRGYATDPAASSRSEPPEIPDIEFQLYLVAKWRGIHQRELYYLDLFLHDEDLEELHEDEDYDNDDRRMPH